MDYELFVESKAISVMRRTFRRLSTFGRFMNEIKVGQHPADVGLIENYLIANFLNADSRIFAPCEISETLNK